MDNAYLLVSDTHFYTSKENRFDYEGESFKILEFVENTARKYSERGFNPVIIFMGDLCDRSYKDSAKATYINNRIGQLAERYNIFINMGNHEFTYYKDNPFWTMISEIESNKVLARKKHSWSPLGLTNMIRVVDRIEDGEVIIHFNHNGTMVSKPVEGKINIGLFHDNYLPSEIKNDVEMLYGTELYLGTLVDIDKEQQLVQGYSQCYFGHMHLVIGDYELTLDNGKVVKLTYLGSLGRSNHAEVRDDMLKRIIPTILVRDGKFMCEERIEFLLPDRNTVVKENVVKAQQDKYKKAKEERLIRSLQTINTDVYEQFRSVFQGDIIATTMIDSFIEGSTCDYEKGILNSCLRYGIERMI